MAKYYIIIFLILLKANLINAVSDSLHNIGHASMKIKTADGKIIYIDPFQGVSADYSDSADIILVTHSHGDHNQVSLVTQKPTCTIISYTQSNINGTYQSFNVDGIKIYSVAAYNQNHPKNECVGYVIEFNGIKLYHAGDTGNIPEMADLAYSNITYALLPCDAVFNMTPQEATQAAEIIQADFSIPIHTERTPDDYNEDNVALFTPINRLLVRHGETIALVNASTDAKNETKVPLSFKLYQSYPNPFNPNTTINFSIPTSSFVTLKIFDVNGKEVTTIVSEQIPAGNHSKQWNAIDMPTGVYFYRLQVGSFKDTKKLILLK